MRRRLYLTAVALTLGLSADAFAQGGGGFGGGGGTGGGFGGSGGGTTTGGTSLGGGGGLTGGGSSFSGGGGSSFSGGSGGSSFSGTGAFSGGGTSFSGGGTSFGGGAAGGGRGIAGGSGGVSISPTNPFAATYVNPMYIGRPGSSNLSMGQAGAQLKGQGFGQPSFGAVTTSGTTGLTGTGLAGRTGTASIGRGLTGGVGGLGGGMSGSSTPQVSYAAQVGFRPAPISVPVVRADLQAMVNRSSALSRPGNVRVEAAGDVIVLRGKVADEDEKRLVEGMVRLEPGVHDVRNELEIGP